jgi:hypothetical protein
LEAEALQQRGLQYWIHSYSHILFAIFFDDDVLNEYWTIFWLCEDVEVLETSPFHFIIIECIASLTLIKTVQAAGIRASTSAIHRLCSPQLLCQHKTGLGIVMPFFRTCGITIYQGFDSTIDFAWLDVLEYMYVR